MSLRSMLLLGGIAGAVYFGMRRRRRRGGGSDQLQPSNAANPLATTPGQSTVFAGTAGAASGSAAGATKESASGTRGDAAPSAGPAPGQSRPVDKDGIEFTGPKETATHYLDGPNTGVDDVTLAQQVHSAIEREPGFPRGLVNVEAHDGVVVLRGQLYSRDETERAEAAARDVSGVREVSSLLHPAGTVAPNQAQVAGRDAELPRQGSS